MCIVRIPILLGAAFVTVEGENVCPSHEWHQMSEFLTCLRECEVIVGTGYDTSPVQKRVIIGDGAVRSL